MDDLSPFSDVVWGARVLGSFVYSCGRLPFWHVLADRYLQEAKVSFWTEGLKIQGKAGPLAVSITGTLGRAQIVIAVPGPPDFTEVSIRRESHIPWKMHEIDTGSESFDKTFFIGGPTQLVFALLDAATRDLLMRAVRQLPGRMDIVDGEIVVDAADFRLSHVLPLLFEIGEWLTQPVDIPQRLVQNATQDPEDGVRLKNLLVLVRERPGDPETRKVILAACSDKSPEVRLRAGRALGAEGLPVVVKLTEDLDDDAVSAEAVSLLGNELPFERIRDVLRHALSKPSPQTARACLAALSHHGDASVRVLMEVLENGHEDLAVFAAERLQQIGNSNAEGPLIQALQKDQPALRVAAANALGRLGSPAAVLPLKEAAERFPSDRDLGQAARQAIATIQLRLPGASPGQLSLAGGEAGQLSLAQAEAGQLSLTSVADGWLSLDDDEKKLDEKKLEEA